MRRAIVFLVFLIPLQEGWGQDRPVVRNQSYVQLLYHTGVYWSRTEYLHELFADGYRAVDARIGIQTTGAKLWQQFHHYPRYGLGIHYSDLVGNPDDTIIGNPFSAFAFYSETWARLGRFTLNTDMAIGLSYTSRIHDPVSNPMNDVIASHINLFFDFNLNVAVMLSRRIDLSAGYGVSHYSNGRIHQPQKGLNNWGWTFSISYLFEGPKPFQRAEFQYIEPPAFQISEELQLMASAGSVEWQPLGKVEGIRFFTSSVTADYAVRTRYRGAVALGLDLMYDGSLELAIKGTPPTQVTTFQKTYLGGHIGYQYFIDRVTLVFNLGTYFLQHSYDRGFIFSRLGGRIRLSDHLHAQVSIKTKNGVRADWIEWGLATTIRIR